MPLRDPRLTSNEISQAYEKPDRQRRSPEDNLTLWQFMSVSWMSSLIAVGSKRQLNDEDVWKLSFEFQHRILHDKFRQLAGSVVRRLLVANGLDLVILLCLGILEAFSTLVWKLIGWPCLFGIVTVIIAQSVNVFVTRILLQYERERRQVTDGKLKKVTQFVGAIRHLRWYGWQDFWQEQIMQSRQQELRLFVVTGLWRSTISVANYLASGLFPVAAFYAYTALAGQPLRIDVAFPALQLFAMLENSLRNVPNLITVLLNANIAVGRIEDFMIEPDKDDAMTTSYPSKSVLMLQDASFVWPGTAHYVLRNISLELPTGLTVICGKVAAGKTALLQALLGELEQRGGNVVLPNDVVGYCAQTPWIQNMSIRDNILFISPYEESRYRDVLEACALTTQDLASFKHGDLSHVGENGIGLSGGQKARVALARAVYSRAKILFLDDPLSALDHQTAETVVANCLCGPLARGRTIVLVTHRTSLCRDVAKKVIEVSNGNAHVIDKDTLPADEGSKVAPSAVADRPKQGEKDTANEATEPEKFIEDEKRVHGGVKAAVYWEYIKAGKLKWWAVLILALALHRLVGLGETWFLKKWGEAYDRPVTSVTSASLFDDLPSPEVDIQPWLLGFFSLAVLQALVFFVGNCIMIVIIYYAGRQMFRDVMIRVSHATFRFYDVTPLGRLMNRLTSDIGTVDGNISQQFEDVAFLAITWISSIVIIASVTPIFLVFSFALTASFVMIFLRFLPTSQSLRRLEVSKASPSKKIEQSS
ncbi:MAG: hypothetical protein Q9168_003511 [Polycauliona sp. 1 TL-2023]